MLKEDGWPFVTPMWYQWRDGSFYVVGRKRSAWVQDLIRDPRCFVCIDEAAMPPEGGLRKVLARCVATVVEGPVVAEGSQWLPVADEMAGRYVGEAGPRGPEGVLRLGALPRPARPGRGRHDDVAGRRLGQAATSTPSSAPSSRR